MERKILTGLDNETVVHCSNKWLALEVLNIVHDAGYTWSTGKSYKEENNWDDYKSETCYDLSQGMYGTAETYEERYNYRILSAEDFIRLNSDSLSEVLDNLDNILNKR